MISAPNRQQLLSGSKLWLVLVTLLLVGACTSQRNTSGPPKGYDVVGENPAPSKPPVSPKDTVLPPIIDIIDTFPKYTHKPFYNVALVLPFYTDSFTTADSKIYAPSQIATDYYSGVLLALDTLKQKGLSIKLHVFDSYPESYLDVLVKGSKLSKMDLIIGPVFNSSMKVMAQFGLEAGIPVWSPFSPAGNIAVQNPFFYMANPRIVTHAHNMIEYVTDSFKNANLITLYQFSDLEKEFLEVYRNHIKEYNHQLSLTLIDSLKVNPQYKTRPLVLTEKFIENHSSGLPKISKNEIEALLVKGKPNVLIIPSMKTPFVLNVLRELYSLTDEYDITLVGTPTLGNDVDLQINYLNALKAHYSNSFYLDTAFYQSNYYHKYVKRFGTEPSDYAVNAYDQMFFLGTMMKEFGTSFRIKMNHVAFEGWGAGFDMNPVILAPNAIDTLPTIDYWDNQHLYMLRYNDYSLERVR